MVTKEQFDTYLEKQGSLKDVAKELKGIYNAGDSVGHKNHNLGAMSLGLGKMIGRKAIAYERVVKYAKEQISALKKALGK